MAFQTDGTDNGTLKTTFDNRFCNWIMKLEQYDYDIQHRPGLDHGNTDGLSRMHTGEGRHCRKPDCDHCLHENRQMSQPQKDNLHKLRDDIVEQITRIRVYISLSLGLGRRK